MSRDRDRPAQAKPAPGDRVDPSAAAEPQDDPGPPPLGDDFAEEHTSLTFADQLRGGPEGIVETETPEGYAGMDAEG